MDSIFLLSKEFYDKEYLKVKTKNEKLKIEKFWMDNNIIKFQGVLYGLNQVTVKCKCNSCMLIGFIVNQANIIRVNISDLLNHGNQDLNICIFKPIIENLMNEYNITFSSTNTNTHIIQLDEGRWDRIAYGNKLKKANSIYNKEIKLYKKFHNELINYIVLNKN
jgi:hypothetical protein